MSGQSQNMEESLRNLDINAAEQFSRDWFGDHANWSHEKLLALRYVEDLVPSRHLRDFGDYAFGGRRLAGGQPSFPLLTAEEWTFLAKPYSEWAPLFFNTSTKSVYDEVGPLFARQQIPDLKSAPRMEFPARLRPLKAKLELGMVPISRDRWLERQMDDPANYRNLFELMNDVHAIFQWYNNEEVLSRTRDAFNWMVGKFVIFERAANARRVQNGITEKLDLAGMWYEYWHDAWTTMSNRAHGWIVDRVDEIQEFAFIRYEEALEAAGEDQTAIGEAGKAYYECVQDLRGTLTKLDYTMGIPMTGFRGFTIGSSFTDLTVPQRKNMFVKMFETKSWKHQAAILDTEDKANAEMASTFSSNPSLIERLEYLKNPAHPRFRDTENLIGHYHEGKQNRDEIRAALRGAPQLTSQENWIAILRERMDFYAKNKNWKPNQFGFVCYRLTYSETDAEWAAFKAKLESDMKTSGDWIQGYEDIAASASIHFVDGREHNIPEGDIAAAKRHFKSAFTMLPTLGRFWSYDFLVVDKQSYASYSTPKEEEMRPPPPYGPCFGDNGGHVRLIDTAYEQLPRDLIDHTAPGYRGEMKVLSTLVFEELYPLIATFSMRPHTLWPCARLHPREVYVGTSDSAQEGWWESKRIDMVALGGGFLEHLRRRQADLQGRN
ncbi:hypothetical protein IQ06DRAFT_294337 [Phaeosphaeriaceae sp. SRC1lsM3a]|nr:hypothetical protein IQ06DRAFT_294337 [Stagonospora sp. SRC1lsM3a]